MRPQQVIADYSKGRITATDACLHLCDAALEHDIEEFAQDVPEEVLNTLKEETQQLPFVGRVFHQVAVARATPIDPEERARREVEEMKRRGDGLRIWKAYFDTQ